MDMEAPAKKRKSQGLTEDERKLLKKYVASFLSVAECADTIGIHRNILDRVILIGRSSPETIEKIKAVIGNSSKEGVQDKYETL